MITTAASTIRSSTRKAVAAVRALADATRHVREGTGSGSWPGVVVVPSPSCEPSRAAATSRASAAAAAVTFGTEQSVGLVTKK